MHATYYFPWGFFYPARTGAETTAVRHLEYFRRRGIRPRLFIATGFWTDPECAKRAAFESHYAWVDDIVVLNVTRRPEIHARLSRWDFFDHLAGHALLAECPEVRRALQRPVELALTNYVFATPLLDALPRDTLRVLESHDLMTAQYLRRNDSPVRFEQAQATEFSLYDLYDKVLMVNEQEAEFARARTKTEVAYVARAVELAQQTDRSSKEDGLPSPSPSTPYDLLFVGSAQIANIEGANWFYSNIFRPLLKPAGLRWAIAGSVCGQLSIDDEQVLRLGVVDDLAATYRQAKVVVVPLFQGTGISIKTLEALGQGKPVVTTPCGRRGLSAAADDVLICRSFVDDPQETAGDLLRLCDSADLQAEYGRRAAAFIEEHFSARAYDRRMDELLAPVFQRRADAARVSHCAAHVNVARAGPLLKTTTLAGSQSRQ